MRMMQLMRLPARVLGPLLLAGWAAACSPIVDAKFDEVQVTGPDVSVPPAAGLSSVTFTFTFDSSQLGANQSLEAQSGLVSVKLNQLSLTAKSGVSDLSFIRELRATALVPLKSSTSQDTKTVRQVEIADYVRRSDGQVGATFLVPLPEPVDILPLLKPSSTEWRRIVLVVNLAGQLPNQSWVTNVSMAVSVELRQ
jgi:hypothetical protein